MRQFCWRPCTSPGGAQCLALDRDFVQPLGGLWTPSPSHGRTTSRLRVYRLPPEGRRLVGRNVSSAVSAKRAPQWRILAAIASVVAALLVIAVIMSPLCKRAGTEQPTGLGHGGNSKLHSS